MLITLIADDLTGACDAGALFAGRAPVLASVGASVAGAEREVTAVDTESRDLEPAAAALCVAATARRLEARLVASVLFKKIDSTLRGPVGAELDALLSTTGRRTVLVCPAFPGQARTVRNGVLRVGGVPAHESPTGRDPAYAGFTSKVADIVRHGTTRPVSSLPLSGVRGHPEDLARALDAAAGHLIIADAETDGDLDALARAARDRPGLMLAGSAGLARAVAASFGYAGARAPLPEGRAWLILAGSLHPSTHAQLQALEASGIVGVRWKGPPDPEIGPLIAELEHGRPVFIATSDDTAPTAGTRAEAATRLALLAATLLARSQPDLVSVTGGDTAVALLRALGADSIELRGVPASGLALGDIVLNASLTLPVLTKAGGFGGPDLFVNLLKGVA
jgi:D-threonate/D-erythronate kinase